MRWETRESNEDGQSDQDTGEERINQNRNKN